MAAEPEAAQPKQMAPRAWWKRRAATILVAATISVLLTILLAVNLTGRYAGYNEVTRPAIRSRLRLTPFRLPCLGSSDQHVELLIPSQGDQVSRW